MRFVTTVKWPNLGLSLTVKVASHTRAGGVFRATKVRCKRALKGIDIDIYGAYD